MEGAAAAAAGGSAVSRPGLAFELKIPFPSSSLAQIALGSLAPDPEPRKEGISKELDVTEDILHVFLLNSKQNFPTSVTTFAFW
uniref:EKC/KEOPS complex subunit LAGE3 isoform X2 n=1 Tax=Podarcis muralis TaxID=64176 RepID=UPI00109F7E7E|nr:EKC/KEOPS complex subunit LAGE3 isoform X2 [Podarcis muralis]